MCGGQQKWGGWNLEGRARFSKIRGAVSKARRKAHVAAIEKAAPLQTIRRKNKIDTPKARKAGKTAPDYVNQESAVVELEWDSDAEDDGSEQDLNEFSGTYKSVHTPRHRRNSGNADE